ncbi:6-phospho-3-hexuloisomerase [Mangrovibacterium diazotrophicum]|uniref:3-hexulose-6-phosphate isomerase n=1 Tax=Mangrovibacterium diazotrophicum TaxID=1261403 RepID=A0A419VWF1_9BACT|nr:6-phospho-3-hexuloisomerase [Mangrovibacterium diazotrophicum]RKD86475.1 3-hexulose-6-phosphate isomerase [Mangrovibacterium diazotrophicum]
MEHTETLTETAAIHEALEMILSEHQQLFSQLQFEEVPGIVKAIREANAIFLLGAGRTGFMIKAAAMRLMHLGYKVHVVGETTTPAIGEGDLLIAGSGSGTTGNIVKAAETARKCGAAIVCFTTNPASPLAQLANHCVTIPAAGKQQQNETVSQQYAGSLFEQSFLLLFDAIIQHLWQGSGVSRDELWKRHTNLE